MSDRSPQTFACPECGARVSVADRTQDALVRSGCPYCTAAVSATDVD